LHVTVHANRVAAAWAHFASVTDVLLQALITGAFSMVYQSMAMGCFPRFRVQHTSEEVGGQIFIPEVSLPEFL
jgi:K+ transporter